MVDADAVLARTDCPAEAPAETLDVRTLPPPQPLRETLETLADLPAATPDGAPAALLQVNDRAPRHLYPRLEERGYRYETLEDGAAAGDAVATVIWPAE
ncbi:MAG: DUF2249 domain-containing protein [Halobacteriaceae archaeon]